MRKISNPKVAIVILNWNGKKDTLECVLSVEKINYDNYMIIVVDNGSEDESVEMLRNRFPDLIIIENKTNLGYAGGNNKGIQYALEHDCECICILNNDTVVDSEIIRRFIDAADEHPNAAVFGAKIFDYGAEKNEKIWYAGAAWNKKDARFEHIENPSQLRNVLSWESIRETAYACGCAMFMKAEPIKKIGLFDPSYFLLWEEVDWCYRARRAGYQCLFVPKAKVWHKCSGSFSGGQWGPIYTYYWHRNRLLWIERNLSAKEAIRIYITSILRDSTRNLYTIISPNPQSGQKLRSKVYFAALKDYLMRKFYDCPDWIKQSTIA